MPRTVFVDDGDCLINLCAAARIAWETVWNHPENKDLRDRRKHHNILKKGDRLLLPDPDPKWVARETEKLHSFVLRSPAAHFSIKLSRFGEPRANEPFVLEVDGFYRKEGLTGAHGEIELPIPPKARRGTLRVRDEAPIDLHFGAVDPIEELSGVQTRLLNLGYYHGPCDGAESPETTAAIAEFQRSADLPGEGVLDDDTRKALVEAHGS